jgi:hypothetical protein
MSNGKTHPEARRPFVSNGKTHPEARRPFVSNGKTHPEARRPFVSNGKTHPDAFVRSMQTTERTPVFSFVRWKRQNASLGFSSLVPNAKTASRCVGAFEMDETITPEALVRSG